MDILQYRTWIKQQVNSPFSYQESADQIDIDAGYAKASLVFHEQDIIELMITNSADGEISFYLHFQLKEEDHAKNLFNELLDTLKNLKNKQKCKILLSCSSALTTSFFAQELNKAAETLKLDYDFAAVSFNHLYEKGSDYDVILLAPQIHYEYDKVKEILQDQIVLKIPAAVFAQYNTGGVFELVMSERTKAALQQKEEHPDPVDPFENNYRILTLGMINHKDMIRFGYRIYDHGKRTLDKEVIKQTFELQDLEDLMDYIVARHKNIDAIALAVPGITYHGVLNLIGYGFINQDIGQSLTDKYGIPVILINDVNAIALGYHAMYREEKNMVFYFQPKGILPGAGIIIDDKLYSGRVHAAGEIGFLIKHVVENAIEKSLTPEGAMEVVTTGLLAFITTMAPEKIVLYSELTPNVNEIKAELAKALQEDFLPEIEHVDRLKTYMLPGAMIHALDVFAEMPDWIEESRKKNKTFQ